MNAKLTCRPFPQQFRQQAAPVEMMLSQAEHLPNNAFSAVVDGERLVIPNRIYHPYRKNTCKGRATIEVTIEACFFSRHHNGHIREECLRFLLNSMELPYFSIPYILKLAEEYVVEPAEVVCEHLFKLPAGATARFLEENPKWMSLMYQRCASYWDCYYRTRYPRLEEYPGIRIIKKLQRLHHANYPSFKNEERQ